MKLILVAFCLVSVTFHYTDGVLDKGLGELARSLTLDNQYKYWESDMAKMEFSTNIELRLVSQDWKPEGSSLPQGNKKQPTYAGSVLEAHAMLKNEKNEYKFEGRPLVDKGLELLSIRNGYDRKKDSIFIFHTISSDSSDDFARKMVIALAMRNFLKAYNVFVVHMPELQSSMHQTVVTTVYGQKASYENIGNMIGDFFNSALKQMLIETRQIHMLSYCYSGQLAGYVARYISTHNSRKKIRSITALDPFSMGLSGIRNKVLNHRDADYVFAYHTNSLLFGTTYRRATADFVFNSGLIQPGCYHTLTKDFNCSHRRAVDLFTYIIIYPEKWLGRKCDTWLFFKACMCNFRPKVIMPFPPIMGIRGIYFLNTNAHKPYGYGFAGSKCYTTNYDKTQYFPDEEENGNGNQDQNPTSTDPASTTTQ